MTKKLILALLIIAVAIGGCYVGYHLRDSRQTDEFDELAIKLRSIQDLIDENAIKPFDAEAAIDNAIAYYVYTLEDMYCDYFVPTAYNDFMDSQQGNFTGIGVKVYTPAETIDKGITILRVIGNSPAESAGIKALDLIVAVDGASVDGQNYTETINKILGEENTDVTLTVERDGERIDITVTRKKFLQREVDYKVINGDIGYVQIHDFNLNAYPELDYALKDLVSMGVKGFVLDVRNNPGGELNTVINMVDLLVEEDEVVVIQYKDGEHIYYSTPGRVSDLPCAVLINESSASASELFASALRDLNGAPLVGMRSFGKGVGQTTYQLDDGSAVKLTTFNYVTKSRTNYDSIGLVPDVEVSLSTEDMIALYTLDETTDEQLAAAVTELYSMIK